MPRLIKQIIYGAFYLLVTAGVVYGIYSLVVSPAPTCFDNIQNQGEEGVDCGGPCQPCALKNLRPIAKDVKTFGADSNTDAVITLSNPNLDFGAESLTYTLNFYDQNGQKIFSLSKNSFIYPAEVEKVIVEPNLKIDFGKIAGAPELLISDEKWQAKDNFPVPRVQTREIKTELSSGIFSVSGLASNRESFGLTRIVVNLLGYQKLADGGRKLVLASKTVLQNIEPSEERAFKIPVPAPAGLKLTDLEPVIKLEVQK